MNQTANYNLKKPEESDYITPAPFNENADTVDAALKNLSDGKADLVDGKVPLSQLPAMDYDPAGSAAAVEARLDSHTGDTANPHAVTAAQARADPAGTAAGTVGAHNTAGDAHTALFAAKADLAALESHTVNADIHITAAERAAWNGKQDALTFDAAPTAESANPVTSGGVKTALDGKAAASHTHSVTDITSGVLPVNRGGTGQNSATPPVNYQALRAIYAGTTDLTAGGSALTTGLVYFVYE